MIRFTLAMLFYVVVARWGYAEVRLSMPSLVPVLDSVMAHVQIPTHDQWPKEAFKKAMGEMVAAWHGSNHSPENASGNAQAKDTSREFGWDLNKDIRNNS